MTTTETAETTESFSAQLRAKTAGDHANAEHSVFMSSLMEGTVPKTGYIDMLAQHLYAYEALEAPLATLAEDPTVAPFHHPGLSRVAALEADLIDLAGADWRTDYPATAPTQAYVARLHEVAEWPGGYVAHHYTRYLGDLSGGQYIGRVAARTYDLTPEHGGRFSRFEDIDAKAFKDGYRAALDAAPWDADEQLRVIDEIREAYRLNTSVFAELDRHMV